jgi:hypothetical protein
MIYMLELAPMVPPNMKMLITLILTLRLLLLTVFILNLAAASGLLISILDISNAFQNCIIFDASERVYLSLPPLYLDWFLQQWPDYNLPSLNIKDLVIQCLKSIQGTKDAGQR